MVKSVSLFKKIAYFFYLYYICVLIINSMQMHSLSNTVTRYDAPGVLMPIGYENILIFLGAVSYTHLTLPTIYSV